MERLKEMKERRAKSAALSKLAKSKDFKQADPKYFIDSMRNKEVITDAEKQILMNETTTDGLCTEFYKLIECKGFNVYDNLLKVFKDYKYKEAEFLEEYYANALYTPESEEEALPQNPSRREQEMRTIAAPQRHESRHDPQDTINIKYLFYFIIIFAFLTIVAVFIHGKRMQDLEESTSTKAEVAAQKILFQKDLRFNDTVKHNEEIKIILQGQNKKAEAEINHLKIQVTELKERLKEAETNKLKEAETNKLKKAKTDKLKEAEMRNSFYIAMLRKSLNEAEERIVELKKQINDREKRLRTLETENVELLREKEELGKVTEAIEEDKAQCYKAHTQIEMDLAAAESFWALSSLFEPSIRYHCSKNKSNKKTKSKQT